MKLLKLMAFSFLIFALASPTARANDLNCGDTLVDSRDGQKYPTIQIGNQCWMAHNLNIGTPVSTSAQLNNNLIEKTCYENQTANCDTLGGLYTWDEAMPFFAIFNIMTSHESQIWYRQNSPISYPDSLVVIPPYCTDDPVVRRDIARNLSNITVMDREFGRIIKELKEAGLYDNSIIIFYSDHGGPMPRQKREVIESGTHVPMIIKLPNGMLAGTEMDELVSFVDIPPTLLSLAGITPPDYMQGQVFLGPDKASPRQYEYAARDRMDTEYDMVRSVRDHQYRYVRNYRLELPYYQNIAFRIRNIPTMKRMLELRDAGKLDSLQMIWFSPNKPAEQLYDVVRDPHTLYDLAGDSAYAEVLERMREANDAWMKSINDKGLNPGGSLKSEKQLFYEMWPNGQQPVIESPDITLRKGLAAIHCPTEGASIAYQINGKGLTEGHWWVYDRPVKLRKGDVITTKAIRIGFKESIEVTAR